MGRRHAGTQSAPRRARLDSMIKHDPHRHVTHDAVHDMERITDCRQQRIAVSLSICHRVRLFCPDRIAYHSGIGVHLLIAFLLPSVCPSRIAFPWWLACPYPTASHHRPWWYLHWLSRFHVGWIQTIEGCTPAKADRTCTERSMKCSLCQVFLACERVRSKPLWTLTHPENRSCG